MANALFTSVKKKFLDADVDLLVGTIKAVLVDNDTTTPNPASHEFYSSIASAVQASATLASKATTGGTLDSADPTFSAASGNESESVALYEDTGGADSTDPLIVYYDTFSSGMPVQPNGGDITLTVNASGFFTI